MGEQVRTAQTVKQLAGPLLEFEAALRPIALSCEWEPGRQSRPPQPSDHETARAVPARPVRLAPRPPRPPMRWVDPDTLLRGEPGLQCLHAGSAGAIVAPSTLLTAAGRGRGRRSKHKAGSDSEDDLLDDEDAEDDVLVENAATKRFSNWSINYRGTWARWAGRHSLPAATAKQAARRCLSLSLLVPADEPSLLVLPADEHQPLSCLQGRQPPHRGGQVLCQATFRGPQNRVAGKLPSCPHYWRAGHAAACARRAAAVGCSQSAGHQRLPHTRPSAGQAACQSSSWVGVPRRNTCPGTGEAFCKRGVGTTPCRFACLLRCCGAGSRLWVWWKEGKSACLQRRRARSECYAECPGSSVKVCAAHEASASSKPSCAPGCGAGQVLARDVSFEQPAYAATDGQRSRQAALARLATECQVAEWSSGTFSERNRTSCAPTAPGRTWRIARRAG